MNLKGIIHFCVILLLFAGVIDSDIYAQRKDKKSETIYSPEENFILKNFLPVNSLSWQLDKRFVYVGDKLNILLQRVDGIFTEDTITFKNKVFRFKALKEEQQWDENKFVVLYFECDGTIYKFDTFKTKLEMMHTSYIPLLPNLVDMDMIEKAQKLFRDMTLHIKTPFWYDEAGNKVAIKKYVPVKIVDIQPGIPEYSVRFIFQSDDNKLYSIFLNLEPSTQVGRYITFDRTFTFKNLRSEYKDMGDDVWELITKGKVKIGMTKNECRLSLGNPTEVVRPFSYGTLKEQWLYDIGCYLFFEDGLLSQFRL